MIRVLPLVGTTRVIIDRHGPEERPVRPQKRAGGSVKPDHQLTNEGEEQP